jgi:hypothetical protein
MSLETIPIKEYPLALHVTAIIACSALIGIILASSEGAIIAAIIAGALAFVNTGLTVWLTGRQEERRGRKRRKRSREEE